MGRAPGEYNNEFTQEILAQSNLQFVCKCMEIARPIRGQEMMGI